MEGKILVTGATGFIGRRLVKKLLAEGFALRCLSRKAGAGFPAKVEVATCDLMDLGRLKEAMKGIHTAYYLVHSLDAGESEFARKDRVSAENFVEAADSAGVGRVIYLSGLGDAEGLSHHLNSRREVAGILNRGKFSTTVLRAAIIIGSGGASYEMLRFLVRTQPLLPDLPGLRTLCQPIAVDNVIGYLAGCLGARQTEGETFDIGGPDILSYRQMLEHLARVAGDVNLYMPSPIYSPWLASRLIGLFSSVDADVALALLKGLDNQVVCGDNRIREILPQWLIPYDRAVELALQEGACTAAYRKRS